ncbi:COG4 transport protein-domain-containing protein [Xylaria digitata]|nr:COG4 transport protein-domain-containing protein [Xylaria digitata]
MSAKNLLNGDLSAYSTLKSSHKLNGGSSSHPSIHDASSLADVRASLAALHTRESAIKNSLDSLISSQADLSRELGRLDILRANLGSQVIATRSISNGMLSSAAETAGRLSNRVKELDLEKDRVQQTLKVVEQVAELKACVHGVVGSMGAPQDWEAAAGYISRASKVPEPIIRGGFAASIVPSVEVPDAPWVTLENSKESLCGLFLREFEKAVKDNDGAKITRFFKLFPLIGRGDVGLDVYGRYVCQGVAGTARATLKEVPGGAGRKDGFFYANALTKLFEHIAQIVESHGGLVERHYGEGKMIRVIERLQMEADVQGGIILDSWSDDRNVSRRLTDVKSYPFSFLVQSFLPQQKTLGGTPRVNSPAIGGGTNPRDSEDEGVNMKEIDGLLNEISVMLGRWSLYTRFLAGKCKVAQPLSTPIFNRGAEVLQSPETHENTILPIPSVLSNSNLQRKVSAKLVEPYNFMSTFFFRRSVEKAFQLDESPPGLSLNLSKPIEANAPFIISAVDDVMYIVSAVIQRSISTSQREVVSHVVSTSGRVLESDFIKMMHQKMQNESYPRAVVQGGLPPEDKIVAFIVLINSLDVSNEYLARIITTRLGSSPDQPNGASHPNPIAASFPFENDVTLVTSSLKNLHSTFTAKTTELLNDGLQVLFNQVVRQRLRAIMAEAFRDADYWRTEEELAEITLQNDEDEDELLDRVPRRFEQGWDALMKPIARLMTAKSYNTLLEITAAHLSKQSLEKRISSYSGKTNAYGAIRMERDFNGIISTVAKGNYSVRELFNRVTQILMITNMEDDEWEELADAGDDGGIDWVLSQEERRRARNLVRE